MSRENAKASHYIDLLDAARCNGSWQDVPELARKIRKHAPQRKCLALTAQSEYQVASYTRASSSTAAPPALAQLIPPLLTAIDAETSRPEEAFQAEICLGWIHWTLGEPALSISRLPSTLETVSKELAEGARSASAWHRVCAIKGTFIKGDAQDKTVSAQEAVDTFATAIPLASQSPISQAGPELRLWTERLITRSCLLAASVAVEVRTEVADEKALNLFRTWSRYWEGKPGHGQALLGGSSAISPIPRRMIWKAYYALLSRRLGDHLAHLGPPQPPPSRKEQKFAPEPRSENRLQQRAELQRAQETYEGLLLQEVQFPMANEYNEEVEAWVELVISNWKVLCGGAWTDEELGEGGKEAVGRGMLDVLYRAATKTFHSTAILRYLFEVHTSLAEFGLAFKAFDTYLSLVSKAKARVAKSEKREPSLDSDELIFDTASNGINALCRYGGRSEAERALEVGELLQTWIDEESRRSSPEADYQAGDTYEGISDTDGFPSFSIPFDAVSKAYRAVGTSKAHWSRLTYDSASRAEIQEAATASFRASLKIGAAPEDNLESLYALALILAEQRQLSAAIDAVRQALLPLSQTHTEPQVNGLEEQSDSASASFPENTFVRERMLLPMWHLLALLLSAKQEFGTAAKACEAAFEQFRDPYNLFGIDEGRDLPRSEHLQEKLSWPPQAISSRKSPKGLVDSMDYFEKETIIEIKMTQIAFLEISEGPETAINFTDELLALYVRLYGEPHLAPSKSMKSINSLPRPPKSSTGTIRSITGSLFGRSKSTRKQIPPHLLAEPPIPASNASIRTYPDTIRSDHTAAPTIEVTSADAKGPVFEGTQQPNQLQRSGSRGEKLVKRSGTLSSKKSSRSLIHKRQKDPNLVRSSSTSRPTTKEAPHANGQAGPMSEKRSHSVEKTAQGRSSIEGQAEKQAGTAVAPDAAAVPSSGTAGNLERVDSAGQNLRPVAHNMSRRKAPLPGGHSTQPPIQDTRLPSLRQDMFSTQPQPRFPREYHRRRTLGLLIKAWLLVGGLFRRAKMYDDSKGAIDEAFGLLNSLEADASLEISSSRFLDDPGLGGAKSLDELWADISAEHGHLLQARSSPYEALESYEQALSRLPDHGSATVGLSHILLDISSQTIAPPSARTFAFTPKSAKSTIEEQEKSNRESQTTEDAQSSITATFLEKALDRGDATIQPCLPASLEFPLELDRLAARDRAYGLLSSHTKLGTGWDNSEVWFALARAQEESGQPDKAREVLWWCVELEDGRPIRHWRNVGTNGYILR